MLPCSSSAYCSSVRLVQRPPGLGPLRGSASSGEKTFRVRLDSTDLSPQDLVATWKANFPSFWPGGARFYAPLAGIAPGEVALLDIPPVPGSPVKLSTGVMVLYADDESFTFMTPEGAHNALGVDHLLGAPRRRGHDRPGPGAGATSDPFDELAYVLGANRLNDQFWQQTLENLARHVGVATPVVDVRPCASTSDTVAPRRQRPQQRDAADRPAHAGTAVHWITAEAQSIPVTTAPSLEIAVVIETDPTVWRRPSRWLGPGGPCASTRPPRRSAAGPEARS